MNPTILYTTSRSMAVLSFQSLVTSSVTPYQEVRLVGTERFRTTFGGGLTATNETMSERRSMNNERRHVRSVSNASASTKVTLSLSKCLRLPAGKNNRWVLMTPRIGVTAVWHRQSAADHDGWVERVPEKWQKHGCKPETPTARIPASSGAGGCQTHNWVVSIRFPLSLG
jgi:hypothetical protein